MSTNPLVIPLGEELPGMPETPAELAAREARRRAARPTEADKHPKRTPSKRASAARQRFAMLNRFVDVGLRGIDATAAKVWLILYRDTRDGIARTGQGDMAHRAGLSTRTVRRALARLESAGLLDVVHRGRIGAGPSIYRIRATPSPESNRTPVSGYNRTNSVRR